MVMPLLGPKELMMLAFGDVGLFVEMSEKVDINYLKAFDTIRNLHYRLPMQC